MNEAEAPMNEAETAAATLTSDPEVQTEVAPADKAAETNTATGYKELTVEERLRSLYRLQAIMTEIDKLKTLRGELPLEVQDLEDEIAGLETRIKNYQSGIEENKTNVLAQKNKIAESKELIERYKSQLDNVRNNREFDNLTKEIEFQGLEIEFAEKKIREFNAAVDAKKQKIKQSKEVLEGRKGDLAQKKSELDEITSETRQEEDRLRDKAKALETTIEPRLLAAFKRIRKGARNGLAVVPIERDACGGEPEGCTAQHVVEPMAIVVHPQHSHGGRHSIGSQTCPVAIFRTHEFCTHHCSCRVTRRKRIARTRIGAQRFYGVFRGIDHCTHQSIGRSPQKQTITKVVTSLDAWHKTKGEKGRSGKILDIVIYVYEFVFSPLKELSTN